MILLPLTNWARTCPNCFPMNLTQVLDLKYMKERMLLESKANTFMFPLDTKALVTVLAPSPSALAKNPCRKTTVGLLISKSGDFNSFSAAWVMLILSIYQCGNHYTFLILYTYQSYLGRLGVQVQGELGDVRLTLASLELFKRNTKDRFENVTWNWQIYRSLHFDIS